MPIIVNLDVMMAKRKISLGELSERMNITPSNLSKLFPEFVSESLKEAIPLIDRKIKGFVCSSVM